MLKEFIFNFNNSELNNKYGIYDLKKLDNYLYSVNILNNKSHKKYFKMNIIKISDTLVFKSIYVKSNLIIKGDMQSKILKLFDELDFITKNINSLFNHLKSKLGRKIKKTKEFHVFKYKNIMISILDEFNIYINEKDYHKNEEYSSLLLLNNVFAHPDSLIDFLIRYGYYIPNRSCCFGNFMLV